MSSVAELVARLGGVASCRELALHGVTPAHVTRAVRVRSLVRVRNGWVAVPSGAPPAVVAAVLAGGSLGCVSALEARSAWTGRDDRRHVRIRRFAHTGPLPPSVLVHRSYPLAGLQPASGGVDSVEWAVAHAVMCQGSHDAVATLDSVLHLGLATRRRLEVVLGQLPRCYSELLDRADSRAESGLESHVRLLLRSVGIGVRLQVAIAGVGRVDLLVGERLVIETDGREWHSDARSFGDDKRRDLALVERGYLMLRLSYAQVLFQSESVLGMVRALVARGEHRWAGRHRRAGLVAP